LTTLSPGEVFAGRYKVLETSEEGSLGTSYICDDFEIMSGRVSLKLLSPRFTSAPGFINSFVMFTKSAMQIHQPGVVQVLEIDSFSDVWYYVTQYVEGENLKLWLQNTLSFEKRVLSGLELLKKINIALEGLHEAGFFTCLKPQNIILSNNQVHLKDFWIAGFLPPDEFESNDSARQYLPYMAPEIRDNWSKLGPLSDIYSVGALLYEIFVGKTPVGTVKKPSECSKLYSAEVDKIVMNFISSDPAMRPQNSKEVNDAINSLLSQFIPSKPVVQPPPPSPPAPEVIEEDDLSSVAGDENVFGLDEEEGDLQTDDDNETLIIDEQELSNLKSRASEELSGAAAAKDEESDSEPDTKAIPVIEETPSIIEENLDEDDIDDAFDKLETGEKDQGDPTEPMVEESVTENLGEESGLSSDDKVAEIEEEDQAVINHLGDNKKETLSGDSEQVVVEVIEEDDSSDDSDQPLPEVIEEDEDPSPVFSPDEADVEMVSTRGIAEDIIPPQKEQPNKYQDSVKEVRNSETEEYDPPPMPTAVKVLMIVLGLAVVGGSIFMGMNYQMPWN